VHQEEGDRKLAYLERTGEGFLASIGRRFRSLDWIGDRMDWGRGEEGVGIYTRAGEETGPGSDGGRSLVP
jgi:hypothetical protein